MSTRGFVVNKWSSENAGRENMDAREREGEICKVKLGFGKITLNSQTLWQKQGKALLNLCLAVECRVCRKMFAVLKDRR